MGWNMFWFAHLNAELWILFSRAEEQEKLRRQNEDDLAKLRPKDHISLRNRYLSRLGAQVLVGFF